MVRIPKNYAPNENALEPLLDHEAEKRRLESIDKRKEALVQERMRRREVKKRTEEILASSQYKTMED